MSLSTPHSSNSLLDGRYRIAEMLGRGGMSTVYKAHDLTLKRDVALKIIHPHLTDNPQFMQRFEQEATAIASLRHPNIITVFDLHHDDENSYMVLELLEGTTLRAELDELKAAGLRLPLNETLAMFTVLCEAVAYAHKHQMVHRDIKPDNIMLTADRDPVLLDFGIAKLMSGNSKTLADTTLGTATYMAPEQAKEAEIDHRADIYSLGVLLFELVSGEPPFQAESNMSLFLKHINEPPPSLAKMGVAVPKLLVQIIERTLAKQPNERFQTVEELASAIALATADLEDPTASSVRRHLDKLSRLWQEATRAVETADFSTALKKLAALRHADGDYNPARVSGLQTKALHGLQRQIEAELTTQSYDAAEALLAIFQQFSDDDPRGPHLRREIEAGVAKQARQQETDALYQTAVSALNQKQIHTAYESWQKWQRQAGPNPLDPQQVGRRAKEALCGKYYRQAVEALAAKDANGVQLMWGQIQAINRTFPDRNNVMSQAAALAASRRRRRALLPWVALVGLLIVIALFGWPRLQAASQAELTGGSGGAPAPVEATPEQVAVILQSAATETPPQPTQTAIVPSPTETRLPPTEGPTETPQPTATTTATPLMPTATVAASPFATSLQSASLFAAPTSGSSELTVVPEGATVNVLGRSQQGSWFFVRYENGRISHEGFAYAPRFEWNGRFRDLPIVRLEEETGGEDFPALTLNINHERTRCNGSSWVATILLSGQGGNGVYTYFWNDERLAGPTTVSYSFDLNATGSTATGTVKVVSGDGQTLTRTFTTSPSNCT